MDLHAIKNLWKDFREYTSLHGVQHIKRETMYKCRWILWTIAGIAVLGLLLWNISSLYVYSERKTTITIYKKKMATELPFPSVTFCKYRSDSSFSFEMNNLKELEHFYKANANVNKGTELDDKYLYLYLSKNKSLLTDFIQYCADNRKLIQCEQYIIPKITKLGLCFTYNSFRHTQEKGQIYVSTTGTQTALAIYFNLVNASDTSGIRMVLHEPGEEPDVLNKGFLLSAASASYVSMVLTKFKHMPAPYTISENQHCMDTRTSYTKNPLKYYPKYSYSGCMLECRRNIIVSQCKCRHITDPGTEELCNNKTDISCYSNADLEYDVNITLREQCDCPLPCEYTEYQHTVSTAVAPANIYLPLLKSIFLTPNYTGKEGLEVRLFFDSLTYSSIESVPEYSFLDIIGIFGGLMGIFLGASLLTLLELFEIFAWSFVIFAKTCFHFVMKKKT